MYQTTTKEDDKLFINSVGKAFEVLEAFPNNRNDLSLIEIMKLTGLNKSAAQRCVHTLWRLGYLQKDAASKRYMLSQKVLYPANSFLTTNPLVKTAMPYLNELRRKLSIRIGLGCLHNDQVMYLIPLQSYETVFRHANPGLTVPTYCTSSGRVLLAFQPDVDIRDHLNDIDKKPYTMATITDIDTLMEKINTTRQQQYCVTKQEYRASDINIAVPVLNPQGEAIAAITAVCSSSEWDEQQLISTALPLLQSAAISIATDCTSDSLLS